MMTQRCPEVERSGGDRYREVKRRAKDGGLEPAAKGLFAQQSGRDHLEPVRHGAPEDGARGHKVGRACHRAGRNRDQHDAS
jgi:hypothetical protein